MERRLSRPAAGYTYQRALEVLLSHGALKDADALIWDLRDGWGGAQPEYLDLFNARAPTMQVTDRIGNSEFVNVKWRKPVAMVINGGTRSGKEVLAYQLGSSLAPGQRVPSWPPLHSSSEAACCYSQSKMSGSMANAWRAWA